MCLEPVILYVDDDAAERAAFTHLFGPELEVLTASSGPAALALMETRPVAVLLADQRLPGMTGAELCGRAAARWPETVRMMVTAQPDHEAVVEAINTGRVGHCFLKPWREPDLVTVLRAGVEEYEVELLSRDLRTDLTRWDDHTSALLVRDQAAEIADPLVVARAALGYIDQEVARLFGGPEAGPASRAELDELRDVAREGDEAFEEAFRRLRRLQEGAPRPPLVTQPVSPAVAIRAALALVRPVIAARARLELDLRPVPRVIAAPAALAQVIAVLLRTMAEATPEGEPDRHTLGVLTEVGDGRVLLAVRGSGATLTPELQTLLPGGCPELAVEELRFGSAGATARELVAQMDGAVHEFRPARGGACLVLTLRPAVAPAGAGRD